jgi:Leucine-rich repeat (LRR) protein
MTRLQRLDLIGSSGITSLPTIISRLVRLDWLALEGCPVRRLPQTMTALTGLRMLSWCSDREATAPLQLRVVWRLRNLCALKIADNHLAALPGAISRLGYLQSLHVHGRAVKAVPGTLSALVRLKTLYVARRLRSLPEGITALTRLREVTTPGVVLHKQLPAVRAFLAGRQAQGCRLELAPSDSNSE